MLVIDSSDAIRGIAEVASKLDFTVNGYIGTTATQLADGQMASTETDLYASGANATVVTSITITNTDTSARTFTLYLTPSGGTSRAISPVSLDLGVSHTFYTDGQRITVMDASGNILYSATGMAINNISDVSVTSAADHDMLYYDNASSTWKNATDSTILSQLSGQAAADFNMPNDQAITFGDAGEKVEGDGADLTITSSNLLNLSAATDIIIPVNIGLKFGDGGEHIETNNTDFTITSGGELNLTAASDVVIPVNVGLHLGDGTSKLESNDTDLTINAGGDIALTATDDINIPVNVGLRFGDGGENIESDNTDLTLTSGVDINLAATGAVVIPTGLTGVVRADAGVLSMDTTLDADSVAAVEAAGLTFAEDKGIILDAVLSGDAHWTGITQAGTAGVALAVGDLVYLESTGKWLLAKADAVATCSGQLGMVVLAAGADTNPTAVLLYGKIRAATLPGLTVGEPVYVSEDDAGDAEDAAPTGSGEIVRIVGYGATAEDLFFCPDNTYIELA